MSKLANAFAKIDHMHLPTRANDTNNKPQIKTPDNLKEKEIHKEKEPDDVCLEVFNFWNTKKLMKCSELDNGLKVVITQALKSFTL